MAEDVVDFPCAERISYKAAPSWEEAVDVGQLFPVYGPGSWVEAPCIGDEACAVSADVLVGLEGALCSLELCCLFDRGDCFVDCFFEYQSVSRFSSGVVV